MPSFSKQSMEKLRECHPALQALFLEVVKDFDCIVTCGHRGEAEQNEAFAKGNSKLKYPNSKHNKKPSEAIDVMPYPVDWKDTKRMYFFAGYVMATAKRLQDDGIILHEIRWGGDWDSDTEVTDQNFNDLPHYEVVT